MNANRQRVITQLVMAGVKPKQAYEMTKDIKKEPKPIKPIKPNTPRKSNV